jgi:serine/threonine-protein kinase
VRRVSELVIGSEIAGYRIGGVLGRGGMGVVYCATDERLGRSAAVKVIAPERAADDTFRRRFLEESRAAAAIDHPNVLPVYAAGEEDGTLFLVTRLVEGPDLARLLEEEGALDPDRALAICGQIGAALDAAHAKGLTHRDVKPGNVLVTQEQATGTELCYLTDFGLAQRVDRQTRLTSSGQLVGTLDYIAPEQIQGGAVDGRADLYALGALFYECVTGEPPFLRDSQPALLYAHLNDPPPRISEHPGGAPPALDPVIAKSLAKSPEDRYPGAAAFIAAARGALSHDRPGADRSAAKTVVSPSPAAAQGTVAEGGSGGRRSRRRRLLVAGALLVAVAAATVIALVALLGGGGGSEHQDTTAALRLTTEEIAVARTLADDTTKLAGSVAAGRPTSGLVGDLEDTAGRAGAVARHAAGELDPGDPSGGSIRGAARDLERAAGHEAEIAAAPSAPAAARRGRESRRSMEDALAGIESALGAMRIGFIAEGNTEVAETVKESEAQLQGVGLTGPFDALIQAL